jgi:hypothetical protein
MSGADAVRITRAESELGRWEIARAAPDPRLAPGLCGFIGVESQLTITAERRLPSGEAAIVVNLGEPYEVIGQAGALRVERAAVMGVHTLPFRTLGGGAKALVLVRLGPPAARRLLGVSMAELAGRWAALADVDATLADALAGAVAAARGWRARFEAVERVLGARLTDARPTPAAAAWQTIRRAGGALSIAALANASGVSHLRFTETFRRDVGVGPKTAARIARFNRVLAEMGRSASPPAYFFKGDIGSHVIETAIGRIGVGICAENYYCFLANQMSERQVDLVLMPHSAPDSSASGGLPAAPGVHLALWYARRLGVPVAFVNKVGAWTTSFAAARRARSARRPRPSRGLSRQSGTGSAGAGDLGRRTLRRSANAPSAFLPKRRTHRWPNSPPTRARSCRSRSSQSPTSASIRSRTSRTPATPRPAPARRSRPGGCRRPRRSGSTRRPTQSSKSTEPGRAARRAGRRRHMPIGSASQTSIEPPLSRCGWPSVSAVASSRLAASMIE